MCLRVMRVIRIYYGWTTQTHNPAPRVAILLSRTCMTVAEPGLSIRGSSPLFPCRGGGYSQAVLVLQLRTFADQLGRHHITNPIMHSAPVKSICVTLHYCPCHYIVVNCERKRRITTYFNPSPSKRLEDPRTMHQSGRQYPPIADSLTC
jgi:hypothetical protein